MEVRVCAQRKNECKVLPTHGGQSSDGITDHHFNFSSDICQQTRGVWNDRGDDRNNCMEYSQSVI